MLLSRLLPQLCVPAPLSHLIQEDDGRVGHELHADGEHLALRGGEAVRGARLAHLEERGKRGA